MKGYTRYGIQLKDHVQCAIDHMLTVIQCRMQSNQPALVIEGYSEQSEMGSYVIVQSNCESITYDARPIQYHTWNNSIILLKVSYTFNIVRYPITNPNNVNPNQG